MSDRKAILILGMHRSGTSVVAKALSLLGASLPRPLMTDQVDTPIGGFEAYNLVSIHDRLLRSAGSNWNDWSRLSSGWYASPCRDLFIDEIIKGLRDSYGESPLFVIKDPRIARFVPIWREVLSRLDIEPLAVIPYRNPLEVARSLAARDRSTVGQGLLLWMRHCLDAEAETRGLARCFVSFESLVGDSQMAAFRMIEALPVAWPRKTAQAISDISSLVEAELHRHRVPLAGLRHPEVDRAVAETYAGLAALEHDESDEEVRARLDGLRSDLDTAADVAFDAFEQLATERQRLDREVADLGERLASLAADVALVRSELELAHRTAAAKREDGEGRDGEALRRLEDRVDRSIAELETRLQASPRSMETDPAPAMVHRQGGQVPQTTGEGGLDGRPRSFVRRLARTGWFRPRRSARAATEGGDVLRRLVLSTGLFDPVWYGERHPEAAATAGSALEHYLSVGLAQNHSPGPRFDATWYLDANPDVKQAGMPAFVHYARSGMAEGRRGTAEPVAPRSGGTEFPA